MTKLKAIYNKRYFNNFEVVKEEKIPVTIVDFNINTADYTNYAIVIGLDKCLHLIDIEHLTDVEVIE